MKTLQYKFKSKLTIMLALMCLAISNAISQDVVAYLNPESLTANQGDIINITIEIDMSASPELLGSFTGSLSWNPAFLIYQSNSGIKGGFTGAINDMGAVPSGQFFFNGANTGGVGDVIEILDIQFEMGAGPTMLDLDFSAMAAAFTFVDLTPVLDVKDGMVCPLLPVELIDFTAEKDKYSSRLKWRTATEINSDYFDIQRSTDAIKWESIGKISAAGESRTERSYSFTDTTPFSGNNYYRLQQVDFDGTMDYSPIEVVKFEDSITTDEILVYPNPAEASFYVEYADSEYHILSIELFDIHGQKIFSQQTNSTQNRWQINTRNFPAGTYLLHLITPTETITKKVIKQ